MAGATARAGRALTRPHDHPETTVEGVMVRTAAGPRRTPSPAERAARAFLEDQRGTPFTDDEWTAIRENVRSFLHALRDLTAPTPRALSSGRKPRRVESCLTTKGSRS